MVDAGRIMIRGLAVILAAGMLAMGCSAGGTALKDDSSGGLARVQDIKVNETGERTTVILSLDRPVTFTSVKLSDPPMMVVDLAGTELGEIQQRMEVGKDPVIYIRPSRDSVSTRIARLEIGLSHPVASSISQDGSMISILFDKTGQETETTGELVAPSSGGLGEELASAKSEPAAVSDAVTPAGTDVTESVEVAAEAEAPLAEATTVTDITLDRSGGSLNVVVEGDGRFADYKVFMVGKDRLVLDIFGVGSLDDKGTLKVGGECVKQVRMASHPAPDEKVRVVLDLAREVDYDVQLQGSDVVVAVAPLGSGAVARVAPSRPASKAGQLAADAGMEAETVAAGSIESKMGTGRKVTVSVPPPAPDIDGKDNPRIYVTSEDGQTVLSSAPAGTGASSSKVMGSDEGYVVTETKIYTGGKISFDIQDAQLDKVIKLLADVAGLNLIMDPGDVKGMVTLKLANVPWDQAMDILLKIYNLDKVIEGNVLRVAPKNKLAEEKRLDLRAIAEQRRLMEEAEELYTKTFKINYADSSELEGKVKKILSKRGEATSNPRTNELIVTDLKYKIEEAGDLIDILDKEVNMILIEARIVTVDVGYSQSLGVSWGLARNPDPTLNEKQPGVGSASGTNSSLEFDDALDQWVLAVPANLGLNAAGLVTGMTWLGILDDVNLDLTISALEGINKAETLAAPKVLTLENEAAQITQGTTLYVQTTSASGTKPEPLNANLSLSVTPRVTGDNFIIMDVNATNNQPSTDVPAGSTASIDTQAVTTNVIVKDGETIVLGGIYTKNKGKTDSGVPWLHRIPILGWLFKERVTNESTSELLIFITPKLVKQQQPVGV